MEGSRTLHLTDNEYKDLMRVERSLKQKHRILEATFTAYTPYMGGGYDTSTWKELDNGEVFIAGFPSAKSIIGRMRWLARIALVGRRGIDSFKDAETNPKVRILLDKT